jgi:hypothetical protein
VLATCPVAPGHLVLVSIKKACSPSFQNDKEAYGVLDLLPASEMSWETWIQTLVM